MNQQKSLMAEKKRIEYIDLAKGICILMVVLVHVVPEFGEKSSFLSCVRMPLYFCLSGLFYKDYGSLKNFFCKKINKILIPFVAWYFIGYAIYYAGRIVLSSSSDATFSLNDIFYSNEIFNLPIWFLLCLFWCNVLFVIVQRFFKKWYLQISAVFFISMTGWAMSFFDVFNLFYIGSSMTCLPFFYIGYQLRQTGFLYKDLKNSHSFFIMCISLMLALLIALVPDSPPRLNYYKNEIIYGNLLLIYICSSAFVVGVLMLCKMIGSVPFVSWIGRYSIIVLVSHMWMRDLVKTAIDLSFGNALDILLLEVLTFIVVMLLMTIFIPFCRQYLPYITAQKDIFEIREKIGGYKMV